MKYFIFNNNFNQPRETISRSNTFHASNFEIFITVNELYWVIFGFSLQLSRHM